MGVKFLTLNILHGGTIWDKLINFVLKEKPDIACFQEVYDGHAPNLEKRFRTMDEFKKNFDWLPYSVFEPTVIDSSRNLPWGNAIFSKFEILDKKNYFFDKTLGKYNFELDSDPREVPEGMVEAKIKIYEKELYVYSWHGVWDVHGDDNSRRDKMGDVIVDALKDKDKVILAGDSNLKPNTKFTKRIEDELKLRSVFKDSIDSTFNMKYKYKPVFATTVVDMIFVPNSIKVLDKYMPMDDVSDHRPLIATLDI